jgi:hypothetical protein
MFHPPAQLPLHWLPAFHEREPHRRASAGTADASPCAIVVISRADLIEIGTDLSLVAGAARNAVRAGKFVAPDRLVSYLDPVAARRKSDGRSLASDLLELAGVRPVGWQYG